jgi:hypothetical protein
MRFAAIDAVSQLDRNVQNAVVEIHRSQITGGVENTVPLHVETPRSGGRLSDSTFEVALHYSCKFPEDKSILFQFSFRSGVTA